MEPEEEDPVAVGHAGRSARRHRTDRRHCHPRYDHRHSGVRGQEGTGRLIYRHVINISGTFSPRAEYTIPDLFVGGANNHSLDRILQQRGSVTQFQVQFLGAHSGNL